MDPVDGVESGNGDTDAGAKTPPNVTDIEGFISLLNEYGKQVWAWVADGTGCAAECSKYADEIFWYVLQDTSYITWIYKNAKTRPVCWKAFREFRQKVLRHEAYTSLVGHYGSEHSTLKALQMHVENFTGWDGRQDESDELNSEDDEIPDEEVYEAMESSGDDVDRPWL